MTLCGHVGHQRQSIELSKKYDKMNDMDATEIGLRVKAYLETFFSQSRRKIEA